MQRTLQWLWIRMAMLVSILFSATLYAQNAYLDEGLLVPIVSSDKDDYAPGQIAHITGSGWKLDRELSVEFKEEPDYPDFHVFNVTVKDDGTWMLDYPIEERHLGVRFTVKVTGKQSNYFATTTFTDAGIKDVTVSTQTICAGQSITVGFTAVSALNDPRFSDEDPGNFGRNNVFYVQLSNAQGEFPVSQALNLNVNIGQVEGRAGTYSISCQIPGSTVFGSSYKVRVVSSDPVSNGPTSSNFTIRELVSINSNPVNQNITYGGDVSFAVGARGTGLTYQWEEFVSTWQNIPNANNSTYIINQPKVFFNGRKYRVKVSGTCSPNPITSENATLNITALGITGSFTADNKIYDGGTAATVASSDLIGVIGDDDVELTGGTANFSDKHVGTGKTVTLTGATLGGADAGNYSLSSVGTASANITAKAINVTAQADTKVYDGGVSSDEAPVVDALATGDAVATAPTQAYADKNVGASKTLQASGLVINDGNSGNNYAVTYVNTTTGAITTKGITGSFTAGDKVYDGDKSATVLSRTLGGVIGEDDVELTDGTATFEDKNVGSGKTVTLTGASLSGTDAGNYSLSSVEDATADITAKALTISLSASNKVYDGNRDAATTASLAVNSGLVSGDVVNVSSTGGLFDNRNVGTNKTVTATVSKDGADAGNYSANTSATAQADITAKGITGSFTADSKVYDGTDAATVASRSLSGAITNDVVSLTGGTATFADKNVGTGKTVTLTGAGLSGTDAGNYTLNSVGTTTANITALGITGSFTADNKVYDGGTAATVGTRTLTGVITGDVVNLTGGSATFNNKHVGTGKTVTLTGATLGGTDAGNYTLSSVGTTTAGITVRPLTVTATGVDKVYDGTTSATVKLLTDKVDLDQVEASYTSAVFANDGVGAQNISVAGISISGADAGNYSLSNTTATTSAKITPASTNVVLSLSGSQVRYMDQLTLTATVTPNPNASALTGKVIFRIGGVVFGSSEGVAVVPMPGSTDGKVQAMVIGQVAHMPQTTDYTVSAEFICSNTNYQGCSDNSKLLKVVARNATPRDAAVGFYTGQVFAWTTSSSSSRATVALVASLKDENSPAGDLRGAKVTFYYVNGKSLTPIAGAKDLPVGLVNVGDGTVGFASAIAQVDIGSANSQDYQIAVGVSGAYTNDPLASQTMITVSKPIPGGFITGGTRMKNTRCGGMLRGCTNMNTEYQFDIQYTKSGSNPKGKAKIKVYSFYKPDGTLDATLHTYFISTNAIAVLNVTKDASGTAVGTFSAKANLDEYLEKEGVTVPVEGGATFQMVVSQKDGDQQIGITLFRKAGGVWFSSNWDGTKTVCQPVATNSTVYVAGGGGFVASNVVVAPTSINANNNVSLNMNQATLFGLNAAPNPTVSQFMLKAESSSKAPMTLIIRDNLGKLIEVRREVMPGQTIQLGASYPAGMYYAELQQGNNRKVVKLLKTRE